MAAIVESVPNFSEGRRKEVIDAIVQSMRSVPGVRVLDVETDTDHNRTVVTLIGNKDNIQEAAFMGAKTASELIDLNKHIGQHPRMGALDVLPFIPISGVTMKECIDIANRVGSRIGTELRIPVFLYESAAKRPERMNLEDVRRGEFEGLRDAIPKDDTRIPDYGPRMVHPTAGAVAVGARMPLVAFNVNLKSGDLSIAKAIAKKIRTSSGGFPKVKALGLMLAAKGVVQVSMNLTDYTVTGIPQVFEAIKKMAEEQGVEIMESEIIGLIPLDALSDVAKESLKVPGFTSKQVLERRIWD